MKGERGLLRTGEFLVARAARRCPPGSGTSGTGSGPQNCPPSWGIPAWGRPGGAPPGCWAMPSTPPRRRPEARPGPLQRGPPRPRPAGCGQDGPLAAVASRGAGRPAGIPIPAAAADLPGVRGHRAGLWPAAGAAFMIVMIGLLAGRFLPRWAFAVSTVLLSNWLIYLVAASSAGWPAGPPVLARISGWGFGVLAAFYLRDLTVSAIRRRRLHTHKN
jgi:hypothetical protein